MSAPRVRQRNLEHSVVAALTAVPPLTATGVTGAPNIPITVTRSLSSQGDTNGVIYFLGTQLGTQPFANPKTSGFIVSTRSTDGAGTVADVTDRVQNTTYTNGSSLNDWIYLDIGSGRTLVVTSYVLRNYAGGNREPRTWKLQGSNNVQSGSIVDVNAASWTDLDVRSSDTTITGAGFGTFITNQGVATAFRHFRLIQTGVDALGGNYLCVSEIDFYGEITYTPSSPIEGSLVQLNTSDGKSIRQTAFQVLGGKIYTSEIIEIETTVASQDIRLIPGSGGKVNITATTQSTSTTTGALYVSGGVGIGGNIYNGGKIVAGNTIRPILSSTDLSGLTGGDIWYNNAQKKLKGRVDTFNVPLGIETYCSWDASQGKPTLSAFATFDTRGDLLVLDFEDSAREETYFVDFLPYHALTNNGLRVVVEWSATTAVTGNCRWGVQFDTLTGIAGDSYDIAFVGQSTMAAVSGETVTTTITVTAVDLLTGGDMFKLKVFRDAQNSNDTLLGDAELIGVAILPN